MELTVNENLEMIVNVYSQNYNNALGGGIGDFIRGSLFLIQYCIKNNLRFDIDFKNHPISNFLYKKYDRIENEINYNNVSYYYTNNSPNDNIDQNNFLKEFTNYINSNSSKIVYLFSNNYPIYKISNLERTFIRDKFLPNKNLTEYINNRLNYLNLDDKNFNIIHIRLSDSIFKNDLVDMNMFKKIKNIIVKYIKILSIKQKKILLLSNSNTIKQKLKEKFNDLIIHVNNIGHLGNIQNEESLKNTLCDMFIISKANAVCAISDYGHGTGFSKYICELYNIPYCCTIL